MKQRQFIGIAFVILNSHLQSIALHLLRTQYIEEMASNIDNKYNVLNCAALIHIH